MNTNCKSVTSINSWAIPTEVIHEMEIVSGQSLDPLLNAIGTDSPRYLPWVSGRLKRPSQVGQKSQVERGIAQFLNICWMVKEI